MNKRVLYIGGFELPDKNAAAQRVIANAKILRELGYDVLFSGITKSDDFIGEIEGFKYESSPYPKNMKDWYYYLTEFNCKERIKQWKPSIIIAYNYPSIALNRLNRQCKSNNIKLIGDSTEWYHSSNLLKAIDTAYRMHLVNKKLDGQIVISRYLSDFYADSKTLLLPPLVDLSQQKWERDEIPKQSEDIRLVYVGSPGAGGKDLLNLIVDFVSQEVLTPRVFLTIIGITKEQFSTSFDQSKTEIKNVEFMGRLPHLKSVEILKNSDFQIFIRRNTRVNNAGFPTKFVEAISAGIPVITNLTSNLSDFLVDEVNGFVIDLSSESKLKSTLRKAFSCERVQIEEMKRNCRESKIFDFRNYIQVTSDFIKGL